MKYNEIYNICQPVIDWLKEHYPHNHKIVIETTGANLIEDGKLVVLDKNLKSPLFETPCMVKTSEREIQEILDMDTSQIQDDVHRFNIEMLQKLFKYENQPEPKKKDSEVSDNE